MAEKSKTSRGTDVKRKAPCASPAQPGRPASVREAEKHPAEGQDAVEDAEIPGMSGKGDSADTLQPKKSKTTNGSSLLAAKFHTLTSSIHQLMQVITPLVAVAGPPADPSRGKKGKTIDKMMKKVCYKESDDPEEDIKENSVTDYPSDSDDITPDEMKVDMTTSFPKKK